MSNLRSYLVEHPALVWVLGFPLTPSAHSPWGFDVQASVPARKQLGRILRDLPNQALQFLLTATVRQLQDALPGAKDSSPDRFGNTISLDTKHIIAWVVENNPKARQPDRFDKSKQPKGDLDCKLGCKERHPYPRHDGSEDTPSQEGLPASHAPVGEFYWGYASGVVATKVAGWGEFVLAEYTQTFDCGETTYFFPLMQQVEVRLGRAQGSRPLWRTGQGL